MKLHPAWALLVVATALPARADPPASLAAPLVGPFASFPEFLAELQRDGSFANETLTVTAKTDHAAVLTVAERSRGAQPHAEDAGIGRKTSFLAIHGEAGWLVDRELGGYPDLSPVFVLHDDLRNTYQIVDLVERGTWVVLRAVEARFLRYGAKLDKEQHYCIGLEIACRLDTLACAAPIPIAGQADCRPRGATWRAQRWRDWSKLDWHHPITLRDDGTLTVPPGKRLPLPAYLGEVGDQLASTLVIEPGTYRLTR